MSTPALRLVPIAQLQESPLNPRRRFNEKTLDELASSLKTHGMITPILARPKADGYEIAAGHRRYRAAQRAGLTQVPVVVREMQDMEFLEVLTIENLQREDVHPIEEAEGDAITAAASWPLGRIDLDALAIAFFRRLMQDTQRVLFKRHGWDPEETKRSWGAVRSWDGEGFAARVRAMSTEQLAQFLIELSLAPDLQISQWSGDKEIPASLLDAARRAKVDPQKIEREVNARYAQKPAVKGPKSAPRRVQTSAKGRKAVAR